MIDEIDDVEPPKCKKWSNVRKAWLIINKPNCVPSSKHLFDQTQAGFEKAINEVIESSPEGTRITIAELDYSYNLNVQDAHAYLEMSKIWDNF